MFVIHVTPLIRGTQLESLSYFSSTSYNTGTFVSVPIRGKNQPALVIDCKPVKNNKTALKTASFSLRKLPHQPNPTTISHTILDTVNKLTEEYPSSIGSLLFNLLPPDIRSGTVSYPQTTSTRHNEESTPQILTAKLEDRYLTYQSFIRSTFAHHGSIIVVVPTSSDVKYAIEKLSHGIKDRLVAFSPLQTKKQREQSYKKFSDTSSTKLIITTPSHAYLDRADILAIIVEQSSSNQYHTRTRPYLDHRKALITYASVSGRSIVLGDTVPRTEDEVCRREEFYLTYGEETKRLVFSAPLSIVIQRDKPQPEVPFQLFSKELLISVERALEAKGKVFLYSARRGLAPVVACIDCGFIFRCPDSNTPYSLVRTIKNGVEERWFVSSTSGRRVRASDICTNCGSWRLRERGIGIQYVQDEWKKIMPEVEATILDHTTANTPIKAGKIADEFFSQKSGILIGTQLALPYLQKGVDVSAIISLDATRSIPTWRADESLFRLLLKLRECTHKEVLVQTRTETDNLITYATRGAVERFYDDEIELRRLLKYPPFNTFILLTWIGRSDTVIELERPISELLTEFSPQFYNNPNSTPNKTMRHCLIRTEKNDRDSYRKLLRLLKSLPPYIKIEIDPERIV